jgi:hypothetical protein
VSFVVKLQVTFKKGTLTTKSTKDTKKLCQTFGSFFLIGIFMPGANILFDILDFRIHLTDSRTNNFMELWKT